MSFPLHKPQQAIVHHYGNNLTAVELTSTPSKYNTKVIVFIAGLTNGLLDVPYIPQLASAVASQGWSVIQVLLSSSYTGWGTSSLATDTAQIAKLVRYLRSDVGGNREKIVLLGHSTGCQDSIEYLSKRSHEPDFDAPVDGAILQAPVSDYEGLAQELSPGEIKALTDEVEHDYIEKGNAFHILPEKFRKIVFGNPITAYRFNSLLVPRGDDDYFSTHLTQDDYRQSFGKVQVPILILYGSKDEFVPEFVDRQKLIDSWKQATPAQFWSPLSKVLVGATHNIGPGSDEGTIDDFVSTVSQFLTNIQ